jgi:regulator of sirC expression with transglutaminase-like and TPR domain
VSYDAFVDLVNRPADDLRLDRICLALSACFQPIVDDAGAFGVLDEVAGNVTDRSPDGVCRAVFDHGGFGGDADDYYAPENSLLDRVLERRLGMPITLAVVVIEVGRRVDVPFDGVGMPGHFVLLDVTGQVRDPFAGGAVRSNEECAAIVQRLHGGRRVAFDERWLRPVAPRVIVARILANLERSFQLRGERQQALTAMELRAQVPQVLDPRGRRRLADALGEGGRFGSAAALYEALADAHPDAAADLRRQATQLRARLN